MDKVFTSVELAEIKKVVKDNGRSIADNALTLLNLTDDIADVKEEVMSSRELMDSIESKLDILLEMQEKSLTKQELIHIRSLNTEELLHKVLKDQSVLRKDLDNLYDKWGWNVKGVM